MIAFLTLLLFGLVGICFLLLGGDSNLQALLLVPFFYLYVSGVEIYAQKRIHRWEKSSKVWAKYYLNMHKKIGDKTFMYLIFVFKTIVCVIEAWGFYQWFSKMYINIFWIVIHSVFVAILLAYNLYVDTFEGKWYRRLNINIIKDDFVQRKVITMLFLAVFVSTNAFIAFI